MKVFMYQAALLCEDCGEAQRKHLDAAFAENGIEPVDADDESSYDSDRYPKGPYADGGGEADCPQHCDQCGVFLENPLTPDGDTYVRNAAREFETEPGMSWHEIATAAADDGEIALAEWIMFYFAWG